MLQTSQISKNNVVQEDVNDGYSLQKKNLRSIDRLKQWLSENGFLVKRFNNSDLMKFISECPLSPNKKHLTVHSTNFKKGEITLVMKDGPLIICFKLIKEKEGFIIKTTNELAWFFGTRGNFIKRLEHKKVKIWLAQFGIDYVDTNRSDLQKFLEKCPVCGYEKLLRFRRSYTDNILDLQCKCSKNFRVTFNGDREKPKSDDYFSFAYSRKTLKKFDSSGKELQSDKKTEKKQK